MIEVNAGRIEFGGTEVQLCNEHSTRNVADDEYRVTSRSTPYSFKLPVAENSEKANRVVYFWLSQCSVRLPGLYIPQLDAKIIYFPI